MKATIETVKKEQAMKAIQRLNQFTQAAMGLAIAMLTMSAMAAQIEPPAANETVIALFRHGEKPNGGRGMISCEGLGRALALPARLRELIGSPDVAIAPSPAASKVDSGVEYDYQRPLLTIAPAAIEAGIPIRSQLAWNDHLGLALTMSDESLQGKVVYIAWEHHLALQAVKDLYAINGADSAELPDHWESDDFDSVYAIRLRREDQKVKVSFQLLKEGIEPKPACASEAPKAPKAPK